MAGLSKKLVSPFDLEVVEVKVACLIIHFAIEIGFWDPQDSLSIIKAIES